MCQLSVWFAASPTFRPVAAAGVPARHGFPLPVDSNVQPSAVRRMLSEARRDGMAKLCLKSRGDLEQIKFLLGHSSIQTHVTLPLFRAEIYRSRLAIVWDCEQGGTLGQVA